MTVEYIYLYLKYQILYNCMDSLFNMSQVYLHVNLHVGRMTMAKI